MFSDYCKLIKRGLPTYVRIALLNPDETIRKEITNDLWSISGTINVNKQDGTRRTCSITIDASGPDFPLNPSDFWFETKFKVWTGIIIRGEPYIFPQGVFCLTNPSKAYNTNAKTITLQGTDKWCRIDGTMGGVLNKTFKTMFGKDLKVIAENLLSFSRYFSIEDADNQKNVPDRDKIDPKPVIFEDWYGDNTMTETVQYTEDGDVVYTDGSKYYALTSAGGYVEVGTRTESGRTIYTATTNSATPSGLKIHMSTISRSECPYTSSIEAGKTFADILKEYAKMMMVNVYYNADGNLVFKPYFRSLNEASDYNRDLKWNFTISEKEMTALSLTYNFTKVYNDLIILGNISNGIQAQARLQNRNPASPFSIDKIGLKTKSPYSGTKYYSDEQCRELGAYYAQIEMEMEKSGTITSTVLHHLNVGDIVTITTDQDEDRETYLVTGYNLPLGSTGTMSINVTNMRYFTNWTAIDVNGNIIE